MEIHENVFNRLLTVYLVSYMGWADEFYLDRSRCFHQPCRGGGDLLYYVRLF